MSGSEVLFLQEKARTLLGGFLMFAGYYSEEHVLLLE